MALQKSIETESGVVASYWRISGIELRYVHAKDEPWIGVKIQLQGILDEDARADDKKPLSIRSVPAHEYIGSVSAAYGWIKENVPEFSGALDI